MGLLLSVFVVFISVVELLAVYSNVRRKLQPAARNKDYSPLIQRYEAGLHKERCRILKILEDHPEFEGTAAETPKFATENPTFCKSNHISNHLDATLIETESGYCSDHSHSSYLHHSPHANDYIDETRPESPHTVNNSFLHFPPDHDLQPETSSSWTDRVSTNKETGGAKKRMKFGLNLEELEPEWSRAPSPIFKLSAGSPSSSVKDSKSADKSEKTNMTITDLNEQIVPQDYWHRAPSPFTDFLDAEKSWNVNRDIPTDDEDEVYASHHEESVQENSVSKLKAYESWNPNKDIPTEEEDEVSIAIASKPEQNSTSQFDKYKSWNPDKDILTEDEDEVYTLCSTTAQTNTVSKLDEQKSWNPARDIPTEDEDEDYTSRSAKPHKKTFTNIEERQNWKPNKDISTEEEDEVYTLCPGKPQGKKVSILKKHISWNSDKDISTEDENEEFILCPTKPQEEENDQQVTVPDEQFKDMLDGIKHSKSEEKKRSIRRKQGRKSSKQTSLENAEIPKGGESDEAAPSKEKSSASNAFWLIFSGEYTKAMNKDWHGQHFCCWQCDESLTGQRYVLREEHPYCVACYESVFANSCEKCSKIIGIDSKDLSYKDKHWHEACFLCTSCSDSLVDKQFGSKGDRIYCGRCYDEQFASRCDGCGQIFRAGTKKMEYKTRQWHEKCFCCCVCKTPIGTQSFIPREQEIYCAKCYEEKYATRCIKCNKVITSGGVTYKNEPWHRECFTCTNCNTSLAGARFTSRDDKPYCAECFGELFAKRCTACNKPITGIGGTKFISFEDRHWHNDCFFCASCRTSLVGRGFITDAEDIICPECAKQKLM